MSTGLRRGRHPLFRSVEKFEMRLQREAGMSVLDVARYWSTSRATVLRILAELREKLGPEKLPNGRRARSYLGRREITHV